MPSSAVTAPTDPVPACDLREKQNLCIEYIGKANTKSFVEGDCPAYGGPLLDACPAENVIGRCVRWMGTRNEAIETYYTGSEKVFATCEATGGTKQ